MKHTIITYRLRYDKEVRTFRKIVELDQVIPGISIRFDENLTISLTNDERSIIPKKLFDIIYDIEELRYEINIVKIVDSKEELEEFSQRFIDAAFNEIFTDKILVKIFKDL